MWKNRGFFFLVRCVLFMCVTKADSKYFFRRVGVGGSACYLTFSLPSLQGGRIVVVLGPPNYRV